VWGDRSLTARRASGDARLRKAHGCGISQRNELYRGLDLRAIMTSPLPWLQPVNALPFVILLQQSPGYALDQKEAQTNLVQEISAGAIAQIGTLAPLSPPNTDQESDEPFGLSSAVPVNAGELVQKWQTVNRQIKSENAVLLRCLTDRECPVAAQKFLKIIAEGREHDGLERVGRINRAINSSIVSTTDMKQWGVPDRWSSPLETLATDCEDYAIAKYVALLAAGVPKQKCEDRYHSRAQRGACDRNGSRC
jgi:predicted transglutaminase-like cysteine proteinase